ncbi:MAG TPA: ABC transporter ATP-binding protein [Ramlibacter sp.]|uniref:ABC transporter ATP-binding protein n=1 Tax=Ramlibacter sp. TaxID=1917967 RepID=UPI002C217907|nr:ABC transporter ATP-binding protein [Ramlibacter sp.]HVZ45164.1 ABC transporter ATP-binding protein [Ramlibacter sp.]
MADGVPQGGPAPQAFLSIHELLKRFDDVTAVDRVDLDVRRGEVFALLGSSGCGKSTLLRMLAGLETPTSGRVLLDGTDITRAPAYARPINMMFQSYALFPHMSVQDNVAFGLKQEKLPSAEIRGRVDEMLELVQMSRFARRMPQQLSGGQQQRVALARSLAKHPKVLLLDEPLAALDKKIRQQTRQELLDVIDRVGVTCIMVTHDQEEAMTMADRIGVMSEGRLLQVGTPQEIYERPASRFTADFIGDTNLFYGTVKRSEGGRLAVGSPDFEGELLAEDSAMHAPGAAVWISVRPERVRVSRHPQSEGGHRANRATGTVRDVAYLGGSSLLEVELPTQRRLKAVVTVRDGGEVLSTGDAVHVSWAENECVVLVS